jgi:hypothetical protein
MLDRSQMLPPPKMLALLLLLQLKELKSLETPASERRSQTAA